MRSIHFAALAVILLSAGAQCRAQSGPSDPVLVQNDGVKLYRSEYEAELLKLPADVRLGFADSPRRVNDLLTRLIVQKTLAAQARDRKIADDAAYAVRYRLEVDRVLAQLRVVDIEEQAAREFDAKSEQYEARARELYAADRKKFEIPEQVSASHILFDIRKHSRDEGLKLAQDARQKIASGADFNQLAKQISEDPSASTSDGRLGFFGRADMDAAFADAAFSLKSPGELSAPVLSQFGWHVIKLEERRPAVLRSFADVRAVILGDLRRKYIDEKREAAIAAIRGNPALKVEQEAVEALYGKRPDPEILKRAQDGQDKMTPAQPAAPPVAK